MNIKCTLLKLILSLVISPVLIYAVLLIARGFGASYDMTHGETFIIWLLMSILVSNCWVWKK